MNKKLVYIKSLLLFALFSLFLFLTIKYKLWLLFTNKDKLIEIVNSYKTLSVFVFIFLQILQVVIAIIPGEVTGFIGGYLFGVTLGTIYSTIGLSLGSVLAFYIARFFGRPVVLYFMNQKYLEKFDYLMTHKGASISAFLFIMPGFPKDYLCYILGLSKMNFRTFFIISTFGRFISTFMLTLGGSFIRNQYYKSFITLAIIAIAIIFVFYIYRDAIETKLKKMLHKNILV